MTRATLADVLIPARDNGYAVAGLVVLGWEDAQAYVEAAEVERLPLILQAGPGCRAHTPLPILGKMFELLAERASIPIVAHLDHGYELEDCRAAIDAGFTSVMFDGSRLDLSENIEKTAEISQMAHAAGVSCEGEIGFVGYAQGEASARTDPDDAAKFAAHTNVDAMAISVGNVHLQQTKAAQIDLEAVRAIQAKTDTPLVLHGGSGIPPLVRADLARQTNICKFNIGTELRAAFGTALRQTLSDNPNEFDRISILKATQTPITEATRLILRSLANG
jgi:fructose-bisphosphate aldolase class II